jgi:hypothetical protein
MMSIGGFLVAIGCTGKTSQIIHVGFLAFLTVLLQWFDGRQKPTQAAREQEFCLSLSVNVRLNVTP